MTTKKIMVVPCMVKNWLNSSDETSALGHCELQAEDHRLDAAEDEEDQRRDDVKNADPLVVDRRHPAVQARSRFGTRRGNRLCGRSHRLLLGGLNEGFPGTRRASERRGTPVSGRIRQPGLMACGLFNQAKRFSCVLSSVPAQSSAG